MASIVFRSSNAALVAAAAAVAAAASAAQVTAPVKKTTNHPLPSPTSGPSSGAGLIPPERPPKKPHLRAPLPLPASQGNAISPDQEIRRIEASAHELMNLNRPCPPAGGPGQRNRKPPAPDPPMSPPRLTKSMPASPSKYSPVSISPPLSVHSPPPISPKPAVSHLLASPTLSARSCSPDLPPPPPPAVASTGDDVGAADADYDDPLPPPPSPIVLDIHDVAKQPDHQPSSISPKS